MSLNEHGLGELSTVTGLAAGVQARHSTEISDWM